MQIIRSMATLGKRSEAEASSVHYTAGAAAASIMVEAARRAAAKGDVNKTSIYQQLLGMNKAGSYACPFTLSKVTYDKDDHTGSQSLRIFKAKKGKWLVLNAGVISKTFKAIHPGR